MRHSIGVAALIGALSIPAAFAYETGAVCVHDFSAGITCSGQDVRIMGITSVAILEDCPTGDPSTVEASLKLRIAAFQNRYDIGLFLSLNGNSAVSGTQCLHDYLEPPLVTSPAYADSDGNGRPDLSGAPWLNAEPFDPADDCGDIASGTDDLKTLTFRFACVDTNGNGIVDISACASWSNGTSSTCPNISGAAPGSGTRCACDVLDITGIPFAAGGRVAGLAMARSGANLSLAWSSSCSASDTDYAVYEGTLGSFTTHHSAICSTSGATSATIAPSPGNVYYLVVPRTVSKEGSYGRRSGGTERPPAASACVPQQSAGCI